MGAVGWRAGLMNLSVGKLSYWYGQWQIGQCAVSDMFCFILNKPVFQDWSLDNDLDDSLKYGAGGMKLGRLLRAALRRGWSALNSTHGAHFSGRQHVVLLQQTNIASDNISWQAHYLVPIFGLYCWSPAAWFLNVPPKGPLFLLAIAVLLLWRVPCPTHFMYQGSCYRAVACL